jgi:hypothetical protein
LKLAIAVATDDEVCIDFDKPGGTIVASIVEGPDSIVQNKKYGS